jgi:hypothetical protein
VCNTNITDAFPPTCKTEPAISITRFYEDFTFSVTSISELKIHQNNIFPIKLLPAEPSLLPSMTFVDRLSFKERKRVLKFPTGHFMIPIHIAGSNPVGTASRDNFVNLRKVVFLNLGPPTVNDYLEGIYLSCRSSGK